MRHPICNLQSAIALTATLVLVTASPAMSQDPWDPSRVYASRSGIDSLARRFELAAESRAYSEMLRAEARREAEALRTRLREGDFQTGDRIVLTVEGEAALSDSFTVEQGPAVHLPTAGRVSLAGVLRSEIESHLARELAQYIRDPDVRARTTIRISVTGEVAQPGFRAVGSDLLVTDVLAQAGQVTRDADLGKIRIERGNQVVWDSEALGPEIVEGRTLDQLGVRAGDRLVVGRTSQGLGGSEGSIRTVFYLIGLPGAIIGLISIFAR
jgi:protein involved in polysaccharide export with SLBB domain